MLATSYTYLGKNTFEDSSRVEERDVVRSRYILILDRHIDMYVSSGPLSFQPLSANSAHRQRIANSLGCAADRCAALSALGRRY
jgi:hypothetical protein